MDEEEEVDVRGRRKKEINLRREWVDDQEEVPAEEGEGYSARYVDNHDDDREMKKNEDRVEEERPNVPEAN